MGTEIEKKYRLTREGQGLLLERLREVGAARQGEEEFEVNTLYAGNGLNARASILRLRRTQSRAVFTYKERLPSTSAVKRRREDETEVKDADALAAILDALGYKPALIYEKRRTTWHVASVEVVVDVLPFGLFMEIEGEEDAILKAEQLLGLAETKAEPASYPELTTRHGVERDGVIESRF
ncbi:MAG TPA: CYTH domain-containing protein [Pyrinomonadaceae bacterium]|jgi:adenylate cyclase class 2|nr:CYTH domain-containing protein [Pyrinomonadaceae bacterium]